MDLETKLKKWELHNEKLLLHGEDHITFEQWEIGFCGAIAQYVQEEQEKKHKAKKHIKNDSEIAELIRKFGGFYFSCYKHLLKLKLDKQYMFRFVYLCTLMNYDCRVVWGSAKGDNRLALEKDLQEILKLSERECRNTKNELIKHKLIIVNEDKTITINKKYGVRGKIDKRKLQGSVRVMELGIKELYNKAKASEHKRLGLLIEILQYINFNYNILCHNPNESDKSKIKPMNLKELCKVVGYDEKNSNRLKNDLLKIKVNDKSAIAITFIDQGQAISVNPSIYYKGNDMQSLKWLMILFDIFE